MNLRELVDTVDVPETRVAEDAWDRASARLRRRRTIVAGAVAVSVAAVLVGVNAVGPRSERSTPTPATSTPSPSADAAYPPVVIIKPDWENLGTAPALAPGPDVPALSEDPVEHAALVIADMDDMAAAYVLGDDGAWRRLDVEGLTSVPKDPERVNNTTVVRPAGLDADGTGLAIPQLDELVVVDLTTGGVTRYAVPGANPDVLWVDDTHVLVAGDLRYLVDTASGAVEPTDLDPQSRVLADGTTVSWPRGARGAFTWGGKVTQSVVNNAGAMNITPPLVRDGTAIVVNGGTSSVYPPPPYPQVLASTIGVAAVDLASGDVAGYVQLTRPMQSKGTYSALLGWRGKDPVIGLVYDRLSSIRLFVAVWDVQAGTLEPLATLPSWAVSWGLGL